MPAPGTGAAPRAARAGRQRAGGLGEHGGVQFRVLDLQRCADVHAAQVLAVRREDRVVHMLQVLMQQILPHEDLPPKHRPEVRDSLPCSAPRPTPNG